MKIAKNAGKRQRQVKLLTFLRAESRFCKLHVSPHYELIFIFIAQKKGQEEEV